MNRTTILAGTLFAIGASATVSAQSYIEQSLLETSNSPTTEAAGDGADGAEAHGGESVAEDAVDGVGHREDHSHDAGTRAVAPESEFEDAAGTTDGERRGRADAIYVIGSTEELSRIGGSAAIVSTESIRRLSYDDANQIAREIPGVYQRPEDGFGLFLNLSLRGVDSTRSAKLTLMEDGVLMAPAPYSAPSAYYSPTSGRMSSIEVLKGSSQVRYGPHITGGVVHFRATEIPDARAVYLKSLYGFDGESRIHAYYGETIDTGSRAGQIGFVLEGFHRRADGFKDIDKTPDFRDADDTGFSNFEPMLKLAWEPELGIYNRFEYKVGYTDREADETYTGLSDKDFDRDPFRRYSGTRFDNIDTQHFRTHLRHVISPTESTDVTTTVYYNRFHRDWFKLHDLRDAAGTRLSISRAIAEGSTHFATLRGEDAGELRVRHNDRTYHSYGLDVLGAHRFRTGEIDHEVQIGVRLHRDDVRRDQRDELMTQAANGTIVDRDPGVDGDAGDRKQESDALAVFLQDELAIGAFTITPGIRYEHIEQEFRDFNSLEKGTGELDVLAGGIGVAYDITAELNLFAGFHSGFSVPSPRSAIRNELDEERSYSVEIGERYTSSDGSFGVESALFFTRLDDLIVINNIGGTGSGDTESAGEVNSYGLELSARVDPGVHWDWGFSNPWRVGFTLTRAEFADDSNSTDPESIFSGGEKGNQLPYIPEFTISAGTGLEWGPWGVSVAAYYSPEMYTSASNTSRQVDGAGNPDARFGETDAYFVVDVAAFYRVTESFTLHVGAHNVTDERYIASRHPHGPRPGRPLFIFGGVEAEF